MPQSRERSHWQKTKRILFGWCALILTTLVIPGHIAWASSFSAYGVEADWRAAAGSWTLENFEAYGQGVQISSLPGLGIGFDPLEGGGYPVTYLFHGTPYGPMHLANFPNGINEINRWDDIVMRPLPGYQLMALGFWNGDGQTGPWTVSAYDASNNLLGSISVVHFTFGGFVSDTPISRVVFNGLTGDGWNHLDGLQAVAIRQVPEPSTVLLLQAGMFVVAGIVRRQFRRS